MKNTQKRIEKMAGEVALRMSGRTVTSHEHYRQMLTKELTHVISQTLEEERERQYEILMSCLPKDAENLSTLTPDQALRLIKCYIKNNPWK